MSILNYDPNRPKKQEFTFESLSMNLDTLQKQIGRTKDVANELEESDDIRKNLRLQKTQEDNKRKYEMYSSAFRRLKKGEPQNSLVLTIETKLDAVKRLIDQLNKQCVPINQRHIILEEKQKKAAEEQARLAAIEEAKSAAQQEEEQRKAMLEFTANQVADIGEAMTVVNELTHEVDDKITEQHETVVHIDETIEDAKQEMIAGNEDLEVAESDQKSGSKVLIIIFIVVAVIVVILGVILGLKFGAHLF